MESKHVNNTASPAQESNEAQPTCHICGNFFAENWPHSFFCDCCCPYTLDTLNQITAEEVNTEHLKRLCEELSFPNRNIPSFSTEQETPKQQLIFRANLSFGLRFLTLVASLIALCAWVFTTDFDQIYAKIALGAFVYESSVLWASATVYRQLSILTLVTQLPTKSIPPATVSSTKLRIDLAFLLVYNLGLLGFIGLCALIIAIWVNLALKSFLYFPLAISLLILIQILATKYLTKRSQLLAAKLAINPNTGFLELCLPYLVLSKDKKKLLSSFERRPKIQSNNQLTLWEKIDYWQVYQTTYSYLCARIIEQQR